MDKRRLIVQRLPGYVLLGYALLGYAPLGLAQQCGLADLDPIAMDTNKNGALSRDEAQGTTLAWAFDRVDANSDGVIDQTEFTNRCAGQAPGAQSRQADSEPSAAEKAALEKAERQKQRQASKVEGRVDKETDKAVDSVIDKGLDRLFGN